LWVGTLLLCRGKGKEEFMTELLDATAENVLAGLRYLENHPHEAPAPYEEFEVGASTYYFKPGGYLYRKDPGGEEVGGIFCGYLADEIWRYLTEEVWHHHTDEG
jgi:hypothetical protein